MRSWSESETAPLLFTRSSTSEPRATPTQVRSTRRRRLGTSTIATRVSSWLNQVRTTVISKRNLRRLVWASINRFFGSERPPRKNTRNWVPLGGWKLERSWKAFRLHCEGRIIRVDKFLSAVGPEPRAESREVWPRCCDLNSLSVSLWVKL